MVRAAAHTPSPFPEASHSTVFVVGRGHGCDRQVCPRWGLPWRPRPRNQPRSGPSVPLRPPASGPLAPRAAQCVSPAGWLPSTVPELELPGPVSGFGTCHCSCLPEPRWAFVTVPVSRFHGFSRSVCFHCAHGDQDVPCIVSFLCPEALRLGALWTAVRRPLSGLADSRRRTADVGAHVFPGREAPRPPSLMHRTDGGAHGAHRRTDSPAPWTQGGLRSSEIPIKRVR